MRVPGEEPVAVEYDVVAGIGNEERPGEECADTSPGCSGCCGKRQSETRTKRDSDQS